MKISRVLNNNVILGEEDNITYLLMGLSIGFKKKIGDMVSSDSVEKMFVLTNPKSANKLSEMITFIPEEYFVFCNDAVIEIRKRLKTEFTDDLYIMLTDHLYSAVNRYKHGIYLENALVMETKKFYKDEFIVAKEVIEMANKYFEVCMGDDEAAFVTFHIVNAQIENTASTIQEMTRLIQEILILIKERYQLDYNEESLSYYRLVTHLKYFSQKVFGNKKDNNCDEEIFELVKTKYKKEYEVALEILELVNKKYNYIGTNMDALYLTTHIYRVINE